MRTFMAGFLLGALVFLVTNLVAANFASDCGLPALFGMDRCADDIVRAGWPLGFYEEGGIAFHSRFDLLALMADIGLGLGLGSGSGWWLVKRRAGAGSTS